MIASSNTPSASRTYPGPDNPVVKEVERRLGLLKEGRELWGSTRSLGSSSRAEACVASARLPPCRATRGRGT